MVVRFLIGLLSLSILLSIGPAARPQEPLDYGSWERGIPDDPSFFPIAVWLQAPRNAKEYRKAGINLYVGLWRGPTEEQLRELKAADMRVICDQKEAILASENADVIVGWMHGDEPDNAQAKRSGKGYDPPILPEVIQKNYDRLRSRDPTRPILLNLGQGVAYDNYIGRGTRRNRLEDYPEYVRGSDIVSFDIYPAVHEDAEVAGKLEFVPRGVERLRKWSDNKKIVWNCIECSRIGNAKVRPTPDQIRSEVWMSLIQGSRGIIYFVHQFEPHFDEASLLHDAELLAAVSTLNQQIAELAPVLNSPTIDHAASITAVSDDAQVSMMCKVVDGSLYLFTANLSPRAIQANFHIDEGDYQKLTVLHESRSLELADNNFVDTFQGYAAHCYQIQP